MTPFSHPTIPHSEIVAVLNECRIAALSETDIQNPCPKFVFDVYSALFFYLDVLQDGHGQLEFEALRQRALLLDVSIIKLRTKIERLDHKVADKLEEELNRARRILVDGDASSFFPGRAQGRFLRRFVGPINVRASKKDVQLKVKEEYNRFRDRTAFLFLLFPSTLLVLKSWFWSDACQLFQFNSIRTGTAGKHFESEWQ